jgi:hypothetical protein
VFFFSVVATKSERYSQSALFSTLDDLLHIKISQANQLTSKGK